MLACFARGYVACTILLMIEQSQHMARLPSAPAEVIECTMSKLSRDRTQMPGAMRTDAVRACVSTSHFEPTANVSQALPSLAALCTPQGDAMPRMLLGIFRLHRFVCEITVVVLKSCVYRL